MRALIILVLTASLLSCGSTKTVRDSKKVIKGEWVISSINYSKAGTYNVKLLDDVSKKCFEYSAWNFIPNNNTGSYNIKDGSCQTGIRNFVFTIQEVDQQTGLYDFLLKPTNEKGKSETNQGFRMRLAAISDMAMQWQQTVSVEGEPFTITMNFTKL